MLNGIWAVMILVGVAYAACTGRMAAVSDAMIASASEALQLCLTMAAIVALWMGLMEIAKQAGLIGKMTKGMDPFMNFMFPRIPHGHAAREYIATNLIANILGLGWACTPAGLKAMEELGDWERKKGNTETERASNEMCDFLILNISSLQLIPVNMIAYRAQYGSEDPTAVIAPAILATCVSTLTAIVFCKLQQKT